MEGLYENEVITQKEINIRLLVSIFVAGVGVTLGMVEMDALTGVERFTFGNLELKSGINYIACMFGLFGLPEVLIQLHNLGKTKVNVVIGKLFLP